MSENSNTLNWFGNYNAETEIAKWAMERKKGHFSGSTSYIPWSIMYAVLKQLDSQCVVERVGNENGGLVFTDSMETLQSVIEGDTKIVKSARVFSHFIKVRITFNGVTHEEAYPIMSKSYGAQPIYDATLVNKAFQRGLARLASQITGVGFSLYTQEDVEIEEADGSTEPSTGITRAEPAKPKVEAAPKPKFEATDDIYIDTATLLAQNTTNTKVGNLIAMTNNVLKREELPIITSTNSIKENAEVLKGVKNIEQLFKGVLANV